ncbi:hypothetical protein [Microbulbifer aggregans]|uniref:hypothetical protein n=1 Tax=Microbulbifer aggregans TaxID=1769779 RepID=UPI001CFC8490|nr:hypothetical protein [Microbulbifer aggregans]
MQEGKSERSPYRSKIRWLYSWIHPTPEGWVTTDWYKKWLDFSFISMLLSILACGTTGWLDFGFSWSLKGVNKSIFEVLKLPLGIATAELAVLALMVSNHRAAQQQRQIVASESHNNFTNYFKHRDYLEKKLNGLKKDQISNPHSVLNGFDIDKIHLRAFPSAKSGDLSCLQLYIDAYMLNQKVREQLEEINKKQELIAKTKDPAHELNMLAIETNKKIMWHINQFGFTYGLTFNPPIGIPTNNQQPTESAEILKIQVYWQRISKVISKVISCGFTEESMAQQKQIEDKAMEWVWNMDRYIELAYPKKQSK